MTLLLAALLLVAQDTTVSSTRGDLILQGAVTDATSALIPGAVVSLRGQDGMLWMSINESGKYSFQGLKPGRYQIQADLPGFERGSQKVELNESPQTDTSYSLRARTKDGAHEVNLNVRRLAGRTVVQLTDSYTLAKN